jgi:hypothetical protein
MPISVNEVLVDPDFASTIDVVRTTEAVNDQGRLVKTETTMRRVIAIVQAGAGQRLVMLDDGSRISDSITVYTTTMLFASASGQLADVVLFGGQRYLVKNVAAWKGWGDGYVRADCEFIGMNPNG